MQVHYNLRHGVAPDRTSVRLRLSTSAGWRRSRRCSTPRPSSCPAARTAVVRSATAGRRSRTCRSASARCSSRIVNGLLLVCDGTLLPAPGPTQSCTRRVEQAATIRAAAGHMHLLGSSLRIELDPGTARARTLLDIPVWNFDDQGAVPSPATRIRPGDTIRVTCTHDQSWRDRLPDLQGLPERYVVWGEGTTDEMCLGLLSVTRP